MTKWKHMLQATDSSNSVPFFPWSLQSLCRVRFSSETSYVVKGSPKLVISVKIQGIYTCQSRRRSTHWSWKKGHGGHLSTSMKSEWIWLSGIVWFNQSLINHLMNYQYYRLHLSIFVGPNSQLKQRFGWHRFLLFRLDIYSGTNQCKINLNHGGFSWDTLHFETCFELVSMGIVTSSEMENRMYHWNLASEDGTNYKFLQWD